ncbi:TetR/AcrR family transcriptional regulator [Saccharopolyspora terrae]|uniref:TetR/AcrR family transcriptional regulator n=1 Tax=Saccharopolyspora terrae TaxID=2530384 RepID=A0A4R4VV91_9PSEU|nr:TetR/AcrR family transcriptional regulator [Saccharopolyspora terrae]TDD06355.1 TetR/AcrR family transcriptional regulator [Saccharopolyspora terrae]
MMANSSSGEGQRKSPSKISQQSPEPRTARGRRTRDRLLAAARVVFETRGFLDTRVGDICDEAGLAQGTFYIYFQSKEDVFYNLVDSVIADRYLLTAVPDDFTGTVADRFAYTLRQYFAEMEHSRRFSRIVEQVATFDERMRENRMQIRRDFRQRVQHGIERLQRQGAADPDVSAELTAEAIVAMINNFAYINLVIGEREDLDIEEVVQTLTNIWARALALDVEKAEANDTREAPRKRKT